MLSYGDLVTVAGFCVIAGIASDKFAYIPVFLALLSPSSPTQAAFVGMVVCVLLSGVFHFTRPSRRQ